MPGEKGLSPHELAHKCVALEQSVGIKVEGFCPGNGRKKDNTMAHIKRIDLTRDVEAHAEALPESH